MDGENVLIEALASSDFKLSIFDKKRTESLELAAIEQTKQQLGEDLSPTAISSKQNNDTESLLAVVKGMSTNQRKHVVELLKQNGLGDPLTKDKIVQNSYTVEKVIRNNTSN